jgi:hypothetical protein
MTLITELRTTCEAWLHYCVARFIGQRGVTQVIINLLQFFFSNGPCGKYCLGTVNYEQWMQKTIVWGTMDAGINNVIYMELHSGPKMANGTRGKMIVAGTIDQGSTVVTVWGCHLYLWKQQPLCVLCTFLKIRLRNCIYCMFKSFKSSFFFSSFIL